MLNEDPYPRSAWGRMGIPPFGALWLGMALLLVCLVALGALSAAMLGTQAAQPDGGPQLVNYKLVLLLTTLGSFGLAGVAAAASSGHTGQELGITFTHIPWFSLLLASLAVLVAQPALQALSWDAESFQLPPSLQQWQDWANSTEAQTEALLGKLLAQDIGLNLLVVALGPAVAEEIFFRGFLLRNQLRWMPPQLAAWLNGLLFSLLHLQPYAFIPRWLLGTAFAYLRLWTGSTLPGMAAHFVNNALAVVLAYNTLQQKGTLTPTDEQAVPGWLIALCCMLAAGLLSIVYFRRHRATTTPSR